MLNYTHFSSIIYLSSRYRISKSFTNSLGRFDITPKGQQIHISTNGPPNEPKSSRHPCFKLESVDALNQLRQNIYTHFENGGEGKPLEADKPGAEDSGEFVFLKHLS
jgi:hypothetical protein